MKAPHNHLERIRWLLAMLVAMCCFGMTLAMQPSQKSDDGLKGAGGSIEPLYGPQKPLPCHDFREYVDEAILRWHETKGTHLIVIARPGVGEKIGALSRIRLRKVESYLAQRYNGEIVYVTAEGSRVKGLGRVEFYVGGKLLASLPVEKNAKTVCLGNVNPFL
jgi:hypothetical protein